MRAMWAGVNLLYAQRMLIEDGTDGQADTELC